MTITFEVKVSHGLLEPLEQVDLPEGEKLTVTVINKAETAHPKETGEQPSKWALLAEKIHKESPLKGHGKDLLKLIKEFREDFVFKHDE
ncbi:MAG: antitoxin family protein [Nitrospirae bacterium]|nr:antitoxin family protein [Nitrospirota bacterium]